MKLSNTIYAMNIAIDTLIKRIDSKEWNDNEIHYYLGTALLWTGLTLEKIENSGIEFTIEEKGKTTAFKGANNALKHLENLVKLDLTEYGFRFDESHWPLVFEQYIRWGSVDNIKEIAHDYQKKAYKKYLEGKSIENTFKDIKEIINKKCILLENLD